MLLAHLSMVQDAASSHLRNVLILEADAVPTLAVAQLAENKSHAVLAALRLQQALAHHPWSVLRLSGMFYSQEFAPIIRGTPKGRDQRKCSRQCQCSEWAGSSWVQGTLPRVHLCEVKKATQPSHRIMPMVADLDAWCDVRDTAAYGIHQSAYESFTTYLEHLRSLPQWLHRAVHDVPAIDNWLPHALPNIYVLPTVVTQPSSKSDSQGATALLRQKSAQQFKYFCAHQPQVLEQDGGQREPRSMKLSKFATRHLYILSDRSMERITNARRRHQKQPGAEEHRA